MLWNDTRAQSIQIGAVLLFGILIILLSTWQAFAVPNQNEEIEFNHNQEVQQQMTELRTTANSMPDASVTRSATVDLGVRYPSRTIFRNPPPATGTIRTLDTDDDRYAIELKNALPSEENLANLWDLDTGSGVYDTGAIQYNPRYNEYNNPPRTIYEHSVVYNKFDREESSLSISGQSLVEGDRITLIALNGSLNENRVDSTSVDFDPISTQTRTVSIEPEPGERVTLDIPTRLDESEWRDILSERHNVTALNSGHEDNPFPADDERQIVRIELDEDNPRESYRLQLAKIGTGTDTTETGPNYLTDRSDERRSITKGESQRLVLEPRDEYNKPLSDTQIEGNILGDEGSLEAIEIEVDDEDNALARSNSEGQAIFEFDSSGVDVDEGEESEVDIEFTITDPVIDPDGAESDPTTVEMTVTVAGPTETEGRPPEFDVFWDEIDDSGNFENCVEGPDGIEECDLPAGSLEELSFGTSPETIAGHAQFSLSNSNIVADFNNGDFSVSFTDGEGTIPISASQQLGETEIIIYSGGSRDKFRINVVESDDLTMRVDDISSIDQSSGEFITSVDAADVTANFERMEIEYEYEGDGQDQTENFDRPRANLRYTQGGGTYGDDFDITIRVFEDDGEDGENLVEERTVEATANAENPIEEVVRKGDSPILDDSTITDQSSDEDGVIYDISYEVTQEAEYDETRAFVVGKEIGSGFDEDSSTATSDTLTLDTYGPGSEFKVAVLVVDEDGVVVDSRIETDVAGEDEDPGDSTEASVDFSGDPQDVSDDQVEIDLSDFQNVENDEVEVVVLDDDDETEYGTDRLGIGADQPVTLDTNLDQIEDGDTLRVEIYDEDTTAEALDSDTATAEIPTEASVEFSDDPQDISDDEAEIDLSDFQNVENDEVEVVVLDDDDETEYGTATLGEGTNQPVDLSDGDTPANGDTLRVEIYESDPDTDPVLDSDTATAEIRTTLNVQDFSSELDEIDGSEEPATVENIDVTVEELDGVDADNVEVSAVIEDSNGDEVDTSETESLATLNGQDTVELFSSADNNDVEVSGADTYTVIVTASADNADDATGNADFTLSESANFVVTNVAPQDPVEEEENLDVEITVENTGETQGDADVRLDVDSNQDGNFDESVDDTTIPLDPGEIDTVTLSYTTQVGDAPEVDVRGDTDDDTSEPVSAEVNLPAGDVEFVASDVGIDDTSQTFTFEPDLSGNGNARIDLSSAQGETIDYTSGTVELLQNTNPNDGVEYDEENNQIIFDGQGGSSSIVEIEISGISVVGEVGDTSRVDYDDDAGDEDSDIFEITE